MSTQDQDLHQVILRWPHTDANEVIVTGTFDQWSSSLRLSRKPNGFEAPVLIPWKEKIAYKFIVDGRWMTNDAEPTEVDVNNVYTAPSKPPIPEPQHVPHNGSEVEPEHVEKVQRPSMSSSSSTSPATPPTTSTTPTSASKLRKVQVLGYLIEPRDVYDQAIKDGTAVEGKIGAAIAAYKTRFADHCGIRYGDLITVRNPKPEVPLAYCVVVATNLSEQSKIPRTDIIEKAKEFLGTEEEPKWHDVIEV